MKYDVTRDYVLVLSMVLSSDSHAKETLCFGFEVLENEVKK